MVTVVGNGVALVALGFLVVQALPRRRWTLVAVAIGALFFVLGQLIYKAYAPRNMGALYYVFVQFWVSSFGYGLITGAITRFAILGWPQLRPSRRWPLVVAAYVAFTLLGLFALYMASSPV